MIHTIGHRSGGFVHCTYPPMTRKAQFRAQVNFQTIGTYSTLAAAKAALTRWHRKHIDEINAERRAYLAARYGT